MDHYIAQRLFDRLDIKKYSWSLDASGNPHVMAGCQIRPIDHIKLGLLLLNKGKYRGKQVISNEIIEKVTEPCVQFSGYGMLWWLEHEKVFFRVDDDLIRDLAESGVSGESLRKITLLKGDYSPDDFFTKAQEIFGPNPREALRSIKPAHITMPKTIHEGNITYVANGYLGNFIFVDPYTNIVALRMTSAESVIDETHFFLDFVELAKHLTD